jgi:hypothetical protein
MMDAVFHPVLNRGRAPRSFISELIAWGRNAPAEIFAPNDNPADVYALTAVILGPWGHDLPKRRAGMLEVMRVHAAFESSWNWKEGVDKTNHTSQSHIEGQETGAWQVSFDSLRLGDCALVPFAQEHGISTPAAFIFGMKDDHRLAMEYYARLVRVSIAWAGPLISRKILPELRTDALAEFQEALSSPSLAPAVS